MHHSIDRLDAIAIVFVIVAIIANIPTKRMVLSELLIINIIIIGTNLDSQPLVIQYEKKERKRILLDSLWDSFVVVLP